MKEQKTEKKAIRSDNVFHNNRAAIHKISTQKNVDVSTAARMWAYAMAFPNFAADLKEFEEYVAELQKETTPKANLVLKYFEGGAVK